VDSSLIRLPLFALCLAVAPAVIAADETAPAKDNAKPAQPTATTEPVVELPKIQISATRAKQIDKEIVKLDKLIAREEKKVKSSELDRALNNSKLATAAAIFGGNSAEHLSAVAASRVALLQTERDVLEAMKRPATVEALAAMQTELEQLRVTRRNLDDAAKQR
jgi:hypothetical protein